MQKYKLKEGFTKASVLAQFRRYNDGTKAYNTYTERCVYATPLDNRCAIGAFIPDGHKALQCSAGVGDLLRLHPDVAQYLPFETILHLVVFQRAHDYTPEGESTHDSVQKFLDDLVEERS